MKAIYPGTFDPITFGHLDIILRAARIYSHVVIAAAVNESKKPLFQIEERVAIIQEVLEGQGISSNIEIVSFEGLLIDFVRKQESKLILRGLRAVSDFEFEFQMALMNKKVAPDIETFFMMPDESYTYLSSFNIKEMARLGGDVSKFVPAIVQARLKEKFKN